MGGSKLGLMAAAGIVLLVAGCHKLVGGGWFYGYGGEKVTFGFQAQCIEDGDGIFDFYYEGQFQYNDRQNGVRFHGDINATIGITGAGDNTCETQAGSFGDQFEGTFSGVCYTQPGRVEGTFEVMVEDNGTPGPTAGDYIWVSTDCTLGGAPYVNAGVLGGGNIKSIGH